MLKSHSQHNIVTTDTEVREFSDVLSAQKYPGNKQQIRLYKKVSYRKKM